MIARLRKHEGMTLVELLITVMIVGIGFVAILGGIWTGALGSYQHRKQADSRSALLGYAEMVKRAAFTACASADNSTGPYRPAAIGYTVPSGYTVQITSIEYLRVDGTTTMTQAACLLLAPTSPDRDLQRIALKAFDGTSESSAKAVETITILKRRPYTT